MEKFTVQVTSEDGPTVVAWLVVDGVEVCAFRGWLMEHETLEVGEIETRPDRLRQGFATSLILYSARVLRVSRVRASVNSTAGEGLFESLKTNVDGIEVAFTD